ncbi:MAG TPA: hypothetical protein VHF02_09020, partial [Luteimonas sp.]|nr:hypothetical protein [Luteimonas sp.]
RRLAADLQQPHCFAFELRGKSLTLLHRTPPSGNCPRFVVSEKSGVAQVYFFTPLSAADAFVTSASTLHG